MELFTAEEILNLFKLEEVNLFNIDDSVSNLFSLIVVINDN